MIWNIFLKERKLSFFIYFTTFC